MKTLICLFLCALVAATYGAPARSSSEMNQAEAQFWGALLRGAVKLAPHVIGAVGGGAEVQDNDKSQAEAQLWGALLRGAMKLAPHVIGAVGGEVEVQDDDDDDNDLVNIEALLSQSLQDRAEMEGFLDILKKVGKGALKVAPLLLNGGADVQDNDMSQAEAQFWGSLLRGAVKLAPHIIGAVHGEVEVQDDDDDDNDRAKMEGFLDILKKVGKGALKVAPLLLNGGADVQDNDMSQAEAQFWGSLLRGAVKLAPHIIGAVHGEVEVQDDDDDDNDRAEMEGFLDILKKVGKGALKVAPLLLNGGAEVQDNDMSQAEAQFWGSLLKGAMKVAPLLVNGGAEVQESGAAF